MIDYLIIGQGIAGSLIAYHLIKRGQKVNIVDDSPPSFLSKATHKIIGSSTGASVLKYTDLIYPGIKSLLGSAGRPKVIGGLITPVTGKRFVKTWMADQLFPCAKEFYTGLEKELKKTFFKATPIVRLFASAQQANDWSVRQSDESYKKYIYPDYIFINENVKNPHGYMVLKQGAIVDGIEMLAAFHTHFAKLGVIKNTVIDYEQITVNTHQINFGKINAKNIIFCEGWRAVNNPFFNNLPFMPAKGEMLIIKSNHLKLTELLNRGIFIRPLNESLYLVGSTYSWGDLSLTPTREARKELDEKIRSLIKTEYTILDQLAGIRPTVKGRRPFIGRHPDYSNVYIFNGLGTKGLLLAPYFSSHFCDHLIKGYDLLNEIDVKRFSTLF